MSANKAAALVIAAGLIAEFISVVVLTSLGANNEVLAIASLVCLIVMSFYAGNVGSHEPRRDDGREARRDH